MAASMSPTFLTLPREIRDMIYEEALTHTAVLPEPIDGLIVGDYHQQRVERRRLALPPRYPRTTLLILCKQIRKEVREYLIRERQYPDMASLHIICRGLSVWPIWTRFPLILISGKSVNLEVLFHFQDGEMLKDGDPLWILKWLGLVLFESFHCLDKDLRPIPLTNFSWHTLSVQLVNEDLYTPNYVQKLFDKALAILKRGHPQLDCLSATNLIVNDIVVRQTESSNDG